jgi:tRNA dimethylallyltransferase
MSKTKQLLVICGPTASGKTDWAIRISQHLGAPIISADSRQFYREMTIGTAKPSMAQLAAAPHHFIDNLSIHDTYTAGMYADEVLSLLEALYRVHDVVILVGGSGLFIRGVCEGFDSFETDTTAVMPEQMQALPDMTMPQMLAALAELDPIYYALVDRHNPRRLQRALAVIYTTGQPYSMQRTATVAQRPFEIHKIGVDIDRAVLCSRIEHRVDQMMQSGLLAEAEALYPFKHLIPLQTVGYQELFEYIDGLHTLDHAVMLIKQHTRQYAKRQMTWFKKDTGVLWIKGWVD